MKPPIFHNRAHSTFGEEEIFYAEGAFAWQVLEDLWSSKERHYAPSPGEGVLYAPVPPVREPIPQKFKVAPSEPEVAPPEAEASKWWRFGFANAFHRAVDCIDRKMQGRILQAIAEIATEPHKARGDTIKPLTGEMAGFWRYRIGDFRLIYYPDEATRTVTLCDFASRGTIYD